jgi:hypothetical protein
VKSRNLVLILAVIGTIGMLRANGDVNTGEFLYQGQLKKDGVPINDTCDFVFSLWTDPVSTLPADQVGPELAFDGQDPNPPSINVTNGLFSALLDFGPMAFTDDPRWIEVSVACPAGPSAYTTLSPRDLVAGAPYSIHTRGIFVDEDGRVGIRNEDPQEALHVGGNVIVESDSSGAVVELHNANSSNTAMFLKSTHPIGFAVTDFRGTSRMVVTPPGDIGIGTERPEALLHVEGRGTFRGEHIAYFESQSGPSSDGIAIQLGNQHTNRENNFITFYNADKIVTGRIEGFDLENGDWIVPPPVPDVGFTFDPDITYNPDWITPGTLPSADFSPGTLPQADLDPGRLPDVTWNAGALPSLTFSGGSLPSADFSPGALPSLSFNDGSLPSFSATYCNVVGVPVLCGFSWTAGSTPSASLNGGSLPSLDFSRGRLPTASFNRGRLPSLAFDDGSLPSLSFSGGSLPSLTFNPGTLPVVEKPPFIIGDPSLTFDLPTQQELSDLLCWSFEHGNQMFLPLDPVSLAIADLKERVAQVCNDEGVVYGSKGADYAEWLPKLNPEDQFQIGQVVGVHGGKVSLETEGAEQIMAISRAPVVVGNVPPDEEKHKFITVGFMGQLPVVVRGDVEAGDFIIASGLNDGTAVAVRPENLKLKHLGRILGRAWSESDNTIFGLVDVSIGLNTNEAAIVLRQHETRMEEQGRANDKLAQENVLLKRQLGEVEARLAALSESVRGLQDSAGDQSGTAKSVASVATDR